MMGTFKVTGLRENFFLKSVRVDGREMIDTPIEIKGNSPLEGVRNRDLGSRGFAEWCCQIRGAGPSRKRRYGHGFPGQS